MRLLWLQAAFAAAALAAPSNGGLNCHGHGNDCLHEGSGRSVGMDDGVLRQMVKNISDYSIAANYSRYSNYSIHPIQPGVSVVVAHQNTVVSYWAHGKANLYQDVNGTKLPKHEQIPSEKDTIYDMASLTKMYTTVAALIQIDIGKLDYHEKVAKYVPEFAKNGKQDVTILQLMTHTSGFDADPSPPLYYPQYKTIAQRYKAIIEAPLLNKPGEKFLYSDLNFMNMMVVLERITGCKLDDLIHDFTSKLGMTDTFFNRGNNNHPPQYARMATTEFQIAVLGNMEPQRPQPVRGTVHDENAWSLDGVSGHAGLFSTVRDTAVLCQMILNNGTYGGVRIMKPSTVDLIFHNFNTKFPDDSHGLGFELGQFYWGGPMAGNYTAGHTGFTGTTMALDRPSNTAYLLFASRVHPSRYWSSNNIAREALGYWVATALGRKVDFPSLT